MKIFTSDTNVLVAVCDSELIGRCFREGGRTLRANEDFYRGEKVSDEDVKRALQGATTGNFTGERAVGCAVACGVIEPGNVIMVEGVPHAIMMRL
ncbi:MAG TPA: DUF424 family protein [Candidatus Methanoperedenaceae archaeon]|nr:DUF424 family protein [Candidatus Methanoperedenaceae archaeon]